MGARSISRAATPPTWATAAEVPQKGRAKKPSAPASVSTQSTAVSTGTLRNCRGKLVVPGPWELYGSAWVGLRASTAAIGSASSMAWLPGRLSLGVTYCSAPGQSRIVK